MIAALFVHPRGPYYGLPNVDPWDERADARKYRGPFPVVAHPPCERWGMLAPWTESRHGSEAVGSDGGCFSAALTSVLMFGGVIEHPGPSLAWEAFNIPRPYRYRWRRVEGLGGWTTQVYQHHYGHRAKKRTWLYVYGYNGNDDPPPPLIWRTPAQPWKERVVELMGHRERRITPVRFRDVLISIAERCQGTASESWL